MKEKNEPKIEYTIQYKQGYADFLLLGLFIFMYGLGTNNRVLYLVGGISLLYWFLFKLRQPENIEHLKRVVDEKKISKGEYDKKGGK